MKVRIFIIILLLGCGCDAMAVSLSGKWAFKTDVYNVGQNQQWFEPAHDVSAWDSMTVPGCWNTKLEYSDYTGVAWYRREFAIDDKNADHNLLLNFEAVYNDAQVWLNGKLLGEHDFGFTAFGFDVTDVVKEKQTNVLVVRVDNSFKLGATWNWGGIRRGVTLNSVPKQRIDRAMITAKPDLKRGSAQVAVKVNIVGGAEGKATVEIRDAAQRVVARKSVGVERGASSVLVSVKLDRANLWSFDTPYLYSARIVLETNGAKSVVDERFGVRKIEIDGYKFMLNGKSVRLNGANYVPYDRFTGSVLPENIFKRDIDQMKSCGVNMARLSHLALPKDVLDYIDERGILIFEEIPLWNKNHYVKANHQVPLRWLSELITERYNHPCIIGWSVGNEIGRLSDNPDIEGYLSSAFKHVKSLDSTRLAVYVTHTAAKQSNEPVLLSDMILFNQYGSHGERADVVHANYPGKPIFYCEYGTKINGEDLNNTTVDLAAMVEGMRGREYLIGASVWTFNDYRSNYKDNATEATQNRSWGVVDSYGRKKRGYYQLQRQNSPVKEFGINAQVSADRVVGSVAITPRELLDLPAYDMVGYSVKVTLFDKNGTECATRNMALPQIKVADKPLKLDFELNGRGVARICAELVSPTQYVVDARSKYFIAPLQPSIDYGESAQSSIRLHFTQLPSTTEWYVRYGIDSLNMSTAPTINNFIDVPELEFGKEYKFMLVACNDSGETQAEKVITVRTTASELPPVITHLKLNGDNIEVGYSSDRGEFIYEFEYGLSENNLDRKIITTATGACNLPVICRDKTHYLKIRMRLRYGYASNWSRVFKVN